MSGEVSADEYLSGLSTKDAKNLENFTDFIRSRRGKYKDIRFGLVVANASPHLINAEPFIRLIVLTSTQPLDKERTVVIPLKEDAAGFFEAQNPPPSSVSTREIYKADIVVSYEDGRLPLRVFFGSFSRTPDMDTMIPQLREHDSPFVLLHRDRFLPPPLAPSLDEARGRKR